MNVSVVSFCYSKKRFNFFKLFLVRQRNLQAEDKISDGRQLKKITMNKTGFFGF